MKENLWLTLVTCLASCVDKELWKAIDYLKEQVRVLIHDRDPLFTEKFDGILKAAGAQPVKLPRVVRI
jgi:hypothetical protein